VGIVFFLSVFKEIFGIQWRLPKSFFGVFIVTLVSLRSVSSPNKSHTAYLVVSTFGLKPLQKLIWGV